MLTATNPARRHPSDLDPDDLYHRIALAKSLAAHREASVLTLKLIVMCLDGATIEELGEEDDRGKDQNDQANILQVR